MCAKLDDRHKGEIDMEATDHMNRRVFLTKYVIKAKEEGDTCWRLRTAIAKAMEEVGDIKGRKVRCVVESEPSKRPMLAAGGMTFSFIERNGGDMKQFKWEYGPFRLFFAPNGSRPTMFLQWSEDKGYEIQPEVLNIVFPNMMAEQAMSQLRDT